MGKKLLFRDKAGNRALIEGTKLAVRNRQGKLVTFTEAKRFILRNKVLRRNLLRPGKSRLVLTKAKRRR